MSSLYYCKNELFIENISVKKIAEQYGTPLYIYSRQKLENNWRSFNEAFSTISHLICYAVKANSNLAILNLLANLGSGFDIVSEGELERVLAAKGDRKKIVFSGVGKKIGELKRALEVGIFCFNIESEAELQRLSQLAHQKKIIANIALRINPNVDPHTHRYISTGLHENKFGIALNQAKLLVEKIKADPYLSLKGVACHIGSQLTILDPFLLALDSLIAFYLELKNKNIELEFINIGGGLGIRYSDESPPSIHDYANAILKKVRHYPLTLILEPGRVIMGEAGALITRVEYLKEAFDKNFAIVDAGMNDLLRPALYEAWQTILPVNLTPHAQKKYDIAGPICESADIIAKARDLTLHHGDLLAVDAVGAYGFSMTSNYNSRCRPAEILVDHEDTYLIRQRESIQDLFALEKMIV